MIKVTSLSIISCLLFSVLFQWTFSSTVVNNATLIMSPSKDRLVNSLESDLFTISFPDITSTYACMTFQLNENQADWSIDISSLLSDTGFMTRSVDTPDSTGCQLNAKNNLLYSGQNGTGTCYLYFKFKSIPNTSAQFDLPYTIIRKKTNLGTIQLKMVDLYDDLTNIYLNPLPKSYEFTKTESPSFHNNYNFKYTISIEVEIINSNKKSAFESEITVAETAIELPTEVVSLGITVDNLNCELKKASKLVPGDDEEIAPNNIFTIYNSKYTTASQYKFVCGLEFPARLINSRNKNAIFDEDDIDYVSDATNLVFYPVGKLPEDSDSDVYVPKTHYPLNIPSVYVKKFISQSLTLVSQLPSDDFFISFFNTVPSSPLQVVGDCSLESTGGNPGDTVFKIITHDKSPNECIISLESGENLSDFDFSLSYHSHSPLTTFYFHQPTYFDFMLEHNIALALTNKDTKEYKLTIPNFSPYYRYCVNIKNVNINYENNEYLITKSTAEGYPECRPGSDIFTFLNFLKPSDYSIIFKATDNEDLMSSYVTILPLLFNSNTDSSVISGGVPASLGDLPTIVIPRENESLQLTGMDYKLHSAVITFNIKNPSNVGMYVSHLDDEQFKLKECHVTDDKKNINPSRVKYNNDYIIASGPFTGKTNEIVSITCGVQLNPKTQGSYQKNIFLVVGKIKVHNDYSGLPKSNDPPFILHGNQAAMEEYKLAQVRWTLTNEDIAVQINRAKTIVVLASKADPASINLLDLTLLNSPSPFEVSNYRYLANSSGKIVSARFSGGFDDFNNQDIQTALDSVINNPNNNFNDMSTSAILDQIFSECIAAGYGCGDLCAPCTGNDACKSDFDCFSGVCSFGQCASFDSMRENSVSVFNMSFSMIIVFLASSLMLTGILF